jgi:hypothetical protein
MRQFFCFFFLSTCVWDSSVKDSRLGQETQFARLATAKQNPLNPSPPDLCAPASAISPFAAIGRHGAAVA